MSGEVVCEVGGAEEETLDLVIETQLANGHQNLKIIVEGKLLINILRLTALPVAQSTPLNSFLKPSSFPTRINPSMACL